MNYETLYYIRSHKDLYRLLRDDSTYYEMIFNNPESVYKLNRIAKEKYRTRFSDKIDSISRKIDILSSFLDVFK